MPLNKLTLFSIALFSIGVLLFILSLNAQNKLKSTCSSSKVNIGFNIILSVSVMLIVFPMSQLACFGACNCTGDDLNYKWISLALLLIIGVSGALVWNGIETNSECDNTDAKSTTIVITIISFLSIFFILFAEKTKSFILG